MTALQQDVAFRRQAERRTRRTDSAGRGLARRHWSTPWLTSPGIPAQARCPPCGWGPRSAAARRIGPAREPPRRRPSHRTIFISDVHLGTRGCKAELLADFLAQQQLRDAVSRRRHRRRLAAQAPLVLARCAQRRPQAILRKIDTGTRVIIVPGNHDEVFRDYCGRAIAGVEDAARSRARNRRRQAGCWCSMATISMP